MQSATYIVNQVWVGSAADHPDKDPDLHQDQWLNRDVIPLDWAGGRVYADRGVDELVRIWSSPLNAGFVGIAIDEFGARDRSVDAMLGEALIEVRRQHPDKFIAVWHAGLIHGKVADAYREAADLIMLETYVSGFNFLGAQFMPWLVSARSFGLAHKTIPVISVGDERYAATPIAVNAQLRWLSEYAQDFAGIGIFAAKASRELASYADEIVTEYYGQ